MDSRFFIADSVSERLGFVQMEYEKTNVQWFPGHMTKAERMISDNMKLVDAVCEILDARIPSASRNPDIDRLCGSKPRLIVLNRGDLADPGMTKQWRRFFEGEGFAVLETDAKSGKGMKAFPAAVKNLRAKSGGRLAGPVRVMVLGIPNVGKSTFINRAAGRKAAVTANRPGVTRGKQWIRVDDGLELLDTPGILWPKFDSPLSGELLAVTGAVRQEILDVETLGGNFLLRLCRYYPDAVNKRYHIQADFSSEEQNCLDLLEEAARKRGFLLSGGVPDTERFARTLLSEYQEGRLGALTLETPYPETP